MKITVRALRSLIREVVSESWKDHLPGGLADKNEPKDFDPEALARGIRVELEHTNDRTLAKEIAMDHLTEDPRYYEKLASVEND